MGCCDGWPAEPEKKVGACDECGGDIDDEGDSTEEGCCWSPVECNTCKWTPCDGSC